MPGSCKCRFPPLRELAALPKSLAGFEGSLRGEERDGKRERRKMAEGTEENTHKINF